MEIDNYGRTCVSADEAFDALYSGKIQTLDNLYFENEITDQFNNSINTNKDDIRFLKSLDNSDLDVIKFDRTNQSQWFLPKEYKNFSIQDWLLEQCKTQVELERVKKELSLFAQHNMMTLLVYLKYLVDTMRYHKIVWGVGRGSSVASYALYLIGVHKINSLLYEIDIEEFLKGESDGKNI